MELTTQQIDTLFQFTKKKYVHWYDLQCELVDHLASRIEEEQEGDPSLDFDRALKKVYDGFGIFGFAHIVQEKEKQLERSSRQLWWKSFRAFFAWPKILLVIGTILVLWKLSFSANAYLWLLLLIPYALSEIFVLRQHRRRRRLMQKPLLLIEYSPLRYSSSLMLFMMMCNVSTADQVATFVVGMIGLLCTMVNLASFDAHKQVQAQAEQLYPEAFAPAS